MQIEEMHILENQENYIKARQGIKGNMGMTAPRFFVVTLNPSEYGVQVSLEGWMGVFDEGGLSFAPHAFMGGHPRRKGWKLLLNLRDRLQAMSLVS